MEYGSEKTIIPVKDLDYGYVIPKRRKNDESVVGDDKQHSIINELYRDLTVNPPSASIIPKNNHHKRQNQQNYHQPSSSTVKKPIYSDYYASVLHDPTLPMELKMQFQPLYCILCAAQLSSTMVAKTHYMSNSHNKKVTKFLVDHSLKTGEPLQKRAKVDADPQDDRDLKYFYCHVCDLPLTGKIHAESHYMGKNHQKALTGKTPAGKGFYDETGKWVRTQQTEPGGDGFGSGFNQTPAAVTLTKFTCDICKISVTSQQHLDMHVAGQKHKKKLLSFNLLVEPTVEIDIRPKKVHEGSAKLCSKYRTPSGLYYCEICNISVNSETQFRQHLGSKKHMKKYNSNSSC